MNQRCFTAYVLNAENKTLYQVTRRQELQAIEDAERWIEFQKLQNVRIVSDETTEKYL